MKKLYTITMMLMVMLTSNLFSQSLPYEVGYNTGGIPGVDGNISSANGWTFTMFFENLLGNYDDVSASPAIYQHPYYIKFYTNNSGRHYIATAVKEITGMGGVSIINYEIKYYLYSSGGSLLTNFSLLGSNDGTNWSLIDTANTGASNTTISGTLINSNNYTWLKIKFDESKVSEIDLRYVKITDMSTGIELNNVFNNYNVYSYNKNLIVKSNDFKEYTLTVYNLNGQVVFNKTTNGNDEFTLDVSNGMYIVNVNDGRESFNQKVVIQ